jgi:transforming growth factor-beta-induced protein
MPHFINAEEDLSDAFGASILNEDNKNILQVAEKLGATIFVKAARLVGLQDALANTQNITVFVPSNRAFARLPKDVYFYFLRHPDRLAALLKYHVAKGTYLVKDLQDDSPYNTLLGNLTLRYDSYNHTSSNYTTRVVQAAKISCRQVDNVASNGVVHIIDEVITKLPLVSAYDIISRSRYFSSLYNGLVVAGMSDSLKGNGPLTLFAPTEKAIKKLPPGVWESLLKDVPTLTAILDLHVVPKTTYARGLKDQDVLNTLNRSNSLTVHIRGDREELDGHRRGVEVTVNDSRIVYFDGAVTNGVIHAIDEVIIPPKIMEKLMQ